MKSEERQFLIESLCEDLVPMIMDKYGLSDKAAIKRSDTTGKNNFIAFIFIVCIYILRFQFMYGDVYFKDIYAQNRKIQFPLYII